MIEYASKMGDGQTVAYKILGILHHIAPDKEAQNACTRVFKSYQEGVEQDTGMATTLAAGLLYGNWPWAEVRVRPASEVKAEHQDKYGIREDDI